MGAFRRRWPGVSYGRGEDWHYVGASGEPAFQNSWANVSGGSKMSFRIRESGVLDIFGWVSGGSSSIVFTLPSDYWPADFTFVPIVNFSGGAYTAGLLSVDPDGEVHVSGTTGQWVIATQVFLTPPDLAP